MFREITTGKKHIINMGLQIDELTKESVGSTGNAEIDKQAEKLLSWTEVVKFRNSVNQKALKRITNDVR